MSGSTLTSPNALFDPGSAVAQQSSIFGTAAPLNAAPGLGTPTNALAPQAIAPTPAAGQPAAAAAAAPVTPLSALDAANAHSKAINQNLYNTTDPTMLGTLGSQGFPLGNDPRVQQDYLAQIAQGTIQVPGISQQMAYDELMRQVGGQAGVNPYGSNTPIPDNWAGL